MRRVVPSRRVTWSIHSENFVIACSPPFRDCFGDDAAAIVVDVQRSDHADYQSDLALRLARQLRRDPHDIAAAMVEHLRSDAVLDAATVSV